MLRQPRRVILALLFGAASAFAVGPARAGAAPAGPEPILDVGDRPPSSLVSTATRKTRVPTSASTITPRMEGPPAVGTPPPGPPPTAPPPAPPPPAGEPITATEAPPEVQSNASPEPGPPPARPVRAPAPRLPTTGPAPATVAVAGALLGLGGFCVGAGRRRPPQEAASAQRTP